ncbi:MAG: tripartite tricarboxylate transporter TctB family protein [Burkholderiales bacterium]|nr:tripartite tricarboxylate transporter TctB family protein [Burkholderiales bacterium]
MSDPHSPDAQDSPTVAKNHTVDAIVAIVILVFGVILTIEAWRLGARWTSDGPGAGYFPFYIGLITIVASLGIFYQSVFGKSRDTGTFVDRAQAMRVLYVLVPATLYVGVTVFLGLYVASAIYIALFMVVLGKYPPVKSVVLSVVIVAVFFLMFEVWFKVPLYKGTLDPLRFLGY